ncbi:MAG: ABC transporter permease [Longimicrobiales bacterium]
MSWPDVWILYLKELRSALRERSIVVNSILIPIFLYPLMIWLMLSGFMLVEGLVERSVSRLAVYGIAESHRELADSLAALPQVELVEVEDRAAARAAVRAGELDAVVEVSEPHGPARALDGNFAVTITYDRAEAGSSRAQARVAALLDRYRARWLEQRAAAIGVSREALTQFRIESENVDTGRELGALILGELIPIMLVIMVALGSFFPAIDTTAGERERSTWETLMTVSASRTSIITAKYLFVATIGILAGLLNVTAMTLASGPLFAPLIAGAGGAVEFRIPLLALPVMMLGAVALALFFAAAMMILASFARTFKDGQSMVTPIYWLALLPLILGESSDDRLTFEIALVPIANVAQMIRDAINGTFAWPLIGLTMLVLLVLVGLCLLLARQVLRFEDHLIGSYDGSFWRFARERLVRGRRTAGENA